MPATTKTRPAAPGIANWSSIVTFQTNDLEGGKQFPMAVTEQRTKSAFGSLADINTR